MHAEQNDNVIPEQREGSKKDITHSIMATDKRDARKLFLKGRNRLLDVNRWSELCAVASSTFRLTDSYGKEVDRTAEKGDYFKIDIPAPASLTGKGYDWVIIEAIEEKSDSQGSEESIIMRVRPARNPQDTGENVAHFFNEEATSSFAVYRHENEVTAAVHGRNEVANTETTNVLDKVRNAIVALTAKLGFSDIQWKSLVKWLVS